MRRKRTDRRPQWLRCDGVRLPRRAHRCAAEEPGTGCMAAGAWRGCARLRGAAERLSDSLQEPLADGALRTAARGAVFGGQLQQGLRFEGVARIEPGSLPAAHVAVILGR